MRGVERSETAPFVQHAKFTIEPRTMAREIPRSLLLRFAREQRAQAVQAVAIILARRSESKMRGSQVVPLGDYIVDFICFEYRLAVEIDGPSHDVSQQRLADKERDK
jgi:very-short-patch-repair endonuclease